MSQSNRKQRPLRLLMAGVGLFAALGATGCQVDIGGQTLPSPYYLTDDVQYFQPGTEFMLPREAAALNAERPEDGLR